MKRLITDNALQLFHDPSNGEWPANVLSRISIMPLNVLADQPRRFDSMTWQPIGEFPRQIEPQAIEL